jgi:hypothetical protein
MEPVRVDLAPAVGGHAPIQIPNFDRRVEFADVNGGNAVQVIGHGLKATTRFDRVPQQGV